MDVERHGYYQQQQPQVQQADYHQHHDADQEYLRIQQYSRTLQERRHRLLGNLQIYPHQKYEIESQLRQVDREIDQCQQQLAIMSGMDQGQYNAGYGIPKPPPTTYNMQSPGDSAISSGGPSGVTTKAPSALADPDDLEKIEPEEDGGDPSAHGYPPNTTRATGYPPSYPDQQGRVAEGMLNSQADRIRMNMFPGEVAGDEATPTNMPPGQQSNLQRLAQPSQLLKTTVSNLANYQSSTDMTAQLLPELGKLLSHPDDPIVLEATKLFLELSKKDASCRAIIGNGNIVSTLIQAMGSTMSAEIQKMAAGTLHNLSNDRQGLLMIYNCGGIPYLVRLLTSQVDAVLFYAVTTLHNLLLHYEPAKMDVRLAGGLEKMVALLVKDNPKFLAIAADCLHLLAYKHQDSKLIILAAGGPALLVRVMRLYTYEKLLWTCSRLLKVLSVCPSNKPEIVQAGGMQALGSHLGNRSTRLVQNILFTIRNLSDAATKQDHLDDLLRQLVALLGSNEVNIVTCSTGILSNLTCNNAKNKTIVCQLHGVEALLRVVSACGGREEIMNASVSALRHLTSRHPSAEMAQNSVRLQNGIPLVVNLMQHQSRWRMCKPLIGLIRNLALCTANLGPMREQSCIPKLWQLLSKAYQDSNKRSVPNGPAGYIDGVHMEEIMELCVGALHLMAREPASRHTIRQLNSIPFFVMLLSSHAENLTRVAAGVLCEIAQDQDGAALIEKENATAPLTELLHSPNEGIAAYAAAVLFCLSDENRPQQPGMLQGGGAPGYYGGGGHMGQMTPTGCMTPSSHGHTPIHYSDIGHTPYSHTPIHSHPGSGYVTPHGPQDLSGIVTPDLDLPLDFSGLDDLPVAGSENVAGFPQPHTPTTHTPHTHHYTPHPHTQHQPVVQNLQHPLQGGEVQYTQQTSYNPPSPAVMETNNAAWNFDSEY
ncbi:junction plakoglobin-like isoform X2 [Halichondria panicea]|uniref:junction plakoglobin-like isoform X2 n=1 Tax=Halichondria panicea TaxID=6063 RepID=UPI00312B3C77